MEKQQAREIKFNIHNLLYLKVEGMKKGYLDYLDNEYSFFKTEDKVDPDVEVVITDRIRPDGNCRLVDNRYFVKEGYLYCRDSYKVARWSLSIDGLEGKTVVHFRGGIWGRHVLKEFILEPLFSFKLATRGFCVLHASAIAINNGGFIFSGGPEAGKTASILSLSVNDNVFLSDDITLLSKDGVVYSLPSSIRICYYRLKGMTPVYQKITPRQKLEAKIKHFAHILSLGYAAFPSDISAGQFFKRTGGAYPLRCLVLLTRTEDENVTVKEIANKKELVERLVLINEQQFPYWFKYAAAYSSVYPSSQVASHPQMMKENLSGALDRVPCYEVKAPHKLTESHRDKFQQAIQGLGGVI